MVENVGLNHKIYSVPEHHVKAQTEQIVYTQKEPEDFEISSETSAAARAYGKALVKQRPFQKLSVKDTINKLEQSGALYRLEKSNIEYEQYTIEVFDKNSNITKRLFWDKGDNANNFAGSQDLLYKNDKLVKIINYEPSGNIYLIEKSFDS